MDGNHSNPPWPKDWHRLWGSIFSVLEDPTTGPCIVLAESL